MSLPSKDPRGEGASGWLDASALARPARLALVFAVFSAFGLALYAPALDGDFVSDDLHYVANNVYVHEFGPGNLLEFLDPTSALVLVTENYAPVHLIAHALQWKAFGASTPGYHVTNVLVHALASVLLVGLFLRTGLPALAALAGGLLFLVHPANVEAVAWISQLKSPAALALGAGALLAHPRRPLLGLVLFTLALFAKPLVAFALPVAVLFGWCRARSGAGDDPSDGGWRWGWLGAWAAALALFSIVEMAAFSATAGNAPFLYEELGLRVRSQIAIVGRYLVMATTGQGLSTWHEPAAATSLADPWWLLGAATMLALAIRTAAGLWRGARDAVYLAWAGMAWVPISGLFLPLTFPMADRYLYFVLPGLLGAALLGARGLAQVLAERGVDRRRLRIAGLALAATLAVAFSVEAHGRMRVWRSGFSVLADAIQHYPEGQAARLASARRAAAAGQSAQAIDDLEALAGRGYSRIDALLAEPSFAGLRGEPRYERLLQDMATTLIERWGTREHPTQLELHVVALAHEVRGEHDLSIQALERALETGGPIDDQITSELDTLRKRREGDLRRRALREGSAR